MEKRYNLLLFFFVSVAVISLAGFFHSYLRFLPDFSKFGAVIHIHFIAFFCWLLLLIVQPYLIKRKKYVLHQRLGSFSYILAPVLVITILLLVKNKAGREAVTAPEAAAMTLLTGLLDAFTFTVSYVMAMVFRRNVYWHVAFIIGATLIIFNPGLSRLLNLFQPGLGLPAAILFPFLVPGIILITEKIRRKRPVLSSPYFLFVLIWTLELLLFFTIPRTGIFFR